MSLLFSLLGFLLALALVVSLLSYAFFWYETASSSHLEVVARTSQGRHGRLLLRLVGLAILSQLAAYGSWLLGLWPGMHRPQALDKSSPVLFVHGLYQTPGGWVAFRQWFRRAGVGNLYAMGYDSLRSDLPPIAEKLKALMREVLAEHPQGKLFLVGHSMGGLVIRLALAPEADGTSGEFAGRIAGVVTLGTPHHGSKLVTMGFGRTARDLLWNSDSIRRLNKSAVPTGFPFLSLYTEFDNMVLPPDAARIPAHAPWREEPVGVCSHMGLIFSPSVAGRVLAFYRDCTS